MDTHIAGCAEVLAIARHRKGFVAEGREGRKASEYANEDKGAKLGREQLAGVGEACECSNQKTAQ